MSLVPVVTLTPPAPESDEPPRSWDLLPSQARDLARRLLADADAAEGFRWEQTEEDIALDGLDVTPGDWIQRDAVGRIRRSYGPDGDDPDMIGGYSIDADGRAIESMLVPCLSGCPIPDWIRAAVEAMPIETSPRTP